MFARGSWSSSARKAIGVKESLQSKEGKAGGKGPEISAQFKVQEGEHGVDERKWVVGHVDEVDLERHRGREASSERIAVHFRARDGDVEVGLRRGVAPRARSERTDAARPPRAGVRGGGSRRIRELIRRLKAA